MSVNYRRKYRVGVSSRDNLNNNPRITDQKLIVEMRAKLQELTHEMNIGTLSENQDKWIKIMNEEMARKGSLTVDQKRVVDSIYDEVME